MKQAVCVLIQLPNTEKYLGVSRRGTTNQWGLPGGKVDSGEDLYSAAMRELKEETGFYTLSSSPIMDKVFTSICGPGPDGEAYLSTTFILKDDAFKQMRANFLMEINEIYSEGDAGPVKWVTRKELEEGPFGEYNKDLFKNLELKNLLK